jgi:hypothetical protein
MKNYLSHRIDTMPNANSKVKLLQRMGGKCELCNC